MSYYRMTTDMYTPPPAAFQDWSEAPVPGWGTNPYRAGPRRVGVGQADCGCGATEEGDGDIKLLGILVAGLAIGALVLMEVRSK